MNNIYQNVPPNADFYLNSNTNKIMFNNLENNNNNNNNKMKMIDSDRVAMHMGDGWCTFPDLDNFDSEILLRALTLKESNSGDSIWSPYNDLRQQKQQQQQQQPTQTLSISALRQLEALFNLSQLLFGLSRAETVNYTFRDLQLRKFPHSFKKSGFKQLNVEGRIDFYAIFEQLVQNIIEEGGLEVTLLIYKNPMLPMVRQKCLDLISNVATVPSVACKIMRQHGWFLDHLLIMVRDGDIISDKIPALSVLIRLLKVMLTERMVSSYMKLVDMQYIDCLVHIFENSKFTDSNEYLPFFIKFEFITMQSLTVILGDQEYSKLWSDKARTHLLNYCMTVLLKAAGAYPTQTISPVSQEPIESINHIFYAEKHSHKHSLAHTIMTVTELLRNDDNMKQFYRYHRPFKQLIVQLYKKYGAKSQYIRTDPGISYALNHLMRVLYIKNTSSNSNSNSNDYYDHKQIIASTINSTSQQQAPRICSNPECKNEETKYKSFKECTHCLGRVAYCSSKCRKEHIPYHRKFECSNSTSNINTNQPLISANNHRTAQRVSSAIAIGSKNNNYENVNYTKNNNNNNNNNLKIYDQLPNNFVNRRNSENLFSHNENNNNDTKNVNIYGTISSNFLSNGSKRLSKYASLNENHRRVSLNIANSNSNNKNSNYANLPTKTEANSANNKPASMCQYTKHTSSMKEIKTSSSNQYRRASHLDEESSVNFKARLMMNSNQNTNKQNMMDETNSAIHFLRPLKTSTALCLSDLSRKQQQKQQQQQQPQHTNQQKCSGDSSSGESSTSNSKLQPIMKKFKLSKESSGSNSTSSSSSSSSKREKSPHQNKQKEEEKESDLNVSNHKRRHSATASILTTQTTTTQMTTTITTKKTSKSSSSSSSSSSKQEEKRYGESSSTNKKSTKHLFDENEFFYCAEEEKCKNVNINSSEYQTTKFHLFQNNENINEKNKKSQSDEDEEGDTSDDVDDLSVTSSTAEEDDEVENNDEEEEEEKKAEEEDEEEIEGERWAINDHHHNHHNRYIKNVSKKLEDQERLSQFKAVKEFERTLELCSNASSNFKQISNTKLSDQHMTTVNNGESSNLNSMAQPAIQSSFEENRKENENKNNEISDSESSDESESLNKHQLISHSSNDILSRRSSSKLKNFKFIINNSIGSHVLKNSFQISNNISNQSSKLIRRPSQTLNEEYEENKFDYNSKFQIPILIINDSENVENNDPNEMPLSLKPIIQNEIENDNFVKPAPPPLLKHNKFSELKVFSNLEQQQQPNQDQVIKSNPQINALLTADMPKNSTPIFTDSSTAALLLNKRKQLLNAKLDLTIAPPTSTLQVIEPQQKPAVFLVPKIPASTNYNSNGNKFSSNSLNALQKEQQNHFRDEEADQLAESNGETNHSDQLPKITLDQTIQMAANSNLAFGSGALNLSKLYSIESTTSANLVLVAKTEMPKGLKSCFKDEIKKDKSKCLIS